MTTNLQFPFDLGRPRRLLMAYFRAEVERCEGGVRAALGQLTAIDGCEIGPFQDCVACLLAGELAVPALSLARDAEHVVRSATRRDRGQGYDTWRARDLDRLIRANQSLATTLRALHAARRALAEAEAAEIQRQKATA